MIKINKADLFWNYAATFLKIGSSILLMPIILHKMSPESVGIWNIFLTISFFLSLVDFGFNTSFTRNITYIFSGVKELKTTGYAQAEANQEQDYGLLKGIIQAMRGFYLKLAIGIFLLLISLGTYYISYILKNYHGNHFLIYVSWILFIIVNTYNLYTLYYETLLLGKGLIKQSKQFIILGQAIYLFITSIFIIYGFDLLSIVIGQFCSVILVRILSYRLFFTKQMLNHLKETVSSNSQEILKTIMPNAIKMGLTSLGGFLVQRSTVLIGSFFLSLEQIGSYGISLQVINVIAGLAVIYQSTYLPKINQLRVAGDLHNLKQLHLKSKYLYIGTFLIGSAAIYFIGPWALQLLHSKTQLVAPPILIIMFLVAFIENNIIISSNIILSKNEIPFYKASLISGVFIVLGLIFMFKYSNLGIANLVIVPLLVDLMYQGWKWPMVVVLDLKITLSDYYQSFMSLLKYKI
jgi:O-antigen/teichoic acid export membrane protein